MIDEFIIHLGKLLKQIRTERDLSQEEFACLLDIDRTYLASIERGERNIAIRNLCKIARGIGCPLSQLIEQVENKSLQQEE